MSMQKLLIPPSSKMSSRSALKKVLLTYSRLPKAQ